MPTSHRYSPARLTSPGAAKLPRSILIAVGLIYILSGLIFRDPWKTDDVIGLATMLTAFNTDGVLSVLLPQVGSLAYAENGPLVTWVGLACMTLFAPIFALFTTELNSLILASRVPNLLWFGMMSYCVWHGTFRLAKRREAQPLPLPFGGEPTPAEYGRMLADASLLFLIATVGIMWRMHETSYVPAIMAFQALAYLGLSLQLYRPAAGTLLLGVALGCALLTRGAVGATPIILASLLLPIFHSPFRSVLKWQVVAVVLGIALFLLWWFPARAYSLYWTQQWLLWNQASFGWPGITGLYKSLRDLLWFLWPTWPMALLAAWNWRHWLRSPHLLLPCTLFATALLMLLVQANASEPEFALLAIPSAVLAAFALPTLRRSIINTLDWFAVMCFSLTAATVWLGWVAQQTGWPPKIAKNIARQTVGFETFISIPALTLALLGSLGWIALVVWRTRRHPPGLWRGTVLSAGGLLATWLLLVTLWLPSLDYARSYRSVSNELLTALQAHKAPSECVRGQGVNLGQRASFYAFTNIDLVFDQRCDLILQQLNRRNLEQGLLPPPENTEVLWVGHRGGDRHEAFRLLRRLPAATRNTQ